MTATVVATGPIMDGRADRAADRMLADSVAMVTDETLAAVHYELDTNLRNPTGYYESQVVADRTREDATVHDSGVVYGPWLEGTSSRNERSRFKGYASFRRARQRVDAEIAAIVRPAVTRGVMEMNR